MGGCSVRGRVWVAQPSGEFTKLAVENESESITRSSTPRFPRSEAKPSGEDHELIRARFGALLGVAASTA